MWLDDARGNAIDWATQRWVQLTGRRISTEQHPWLAGPIGRPTGIGADFFDKDIDSRLTPRRGTACGLLPDFHELDSREFQSRTIAPAVIDFYQRTSNYELDAWSQWCGFFRPFGWALAVIFSRRLQQLNLPLTGLDTSQGMTTEVFAIVDATSGAHAFTAWVRRLVGTGHVIYAGAYSTSTVPDCASRCVRVVFPLPNGNAMVVMRPVAHADGSLTLVSAGDGFGSPGFYFTVHDRQGRVWARYLKSLRESITVRSDRGEVRADHVLTLWGLTFLRLHYRLRPRPLSP